MYELDGYIMLIRSTDFNPFRLAAAYALCSPPSLTNQGRLSYKVSAPRARDNKFGWVGGHLTHSNETKKAYSSNKK